MYGNIYSNGKWQSVVSICLNFVLMLLIPTLYYLYRTSEDARNRLKGLYSVCFLILSIALSSS